MLYYNFKDYAEFQDLFGVVTHGNGAKNRKKRILLSWLKQPWLLKSCLRESYLKPLRITTMAELKRFLMGRIEESSCYYSSLPCNVIYIMGHKYKSTKYHTDEQYGVCEDGDIRSIRYARVDNDRIFKMKIGKMFRHIIEESEFGKRLPEPVKNWLCEEITVDWQAWVAERIPEYELHVDNDFAKIYDSEWLLGDFDSCMTGRDLHTFYEDAVNASAAYLTNSCGNIIARCVIFRNVWDDEGNTWRLAERQYATDSNQLYMRLLVNALIKGDYIDGYKQIGAGCSDSDAFVDNEGKSLSHKCFSIECNLGYGDALSYQDSFKWYDMDSSTACNYCKGYDNIDLATTEGKIEDNRCWDDYHECYCEETHSVYYDGHWIQCDIEALDDFIWIDSECEYYHMDEVGCCPHCGEYFVSRDGYYSELTEQDYCCRDCMEDAEEKYREEHDVEIEEEIEA